MLNFLGFTSSGVKENSIASNYQSSQGNVKSGSYFSQAQSYSMKGCSSSKGSGGKGKGK